MVIVIIAAALLAFILTDAISNGRNIFGNNTTVAKIGDDKIEYKDYQRKQQELSQRLDEARRQNPAQFDDYDSQILAKEALDQLVMEKLVNNAVDATGIRVTPELLRFYMIESPQGMLPEMQSLLQNLQRDGIPIQTPADAYSVIFEPQKYGLTEAQVKPYQQTWISLENLYEEKIGQVVYMQLLQRTFKANDLDIAAMKRDYVAKANVKVAKKPYENLEKINVSDSELQAAYEKRKQEFKIDEITKEVGFIQVAVAPSPADQKQAQALASKVVAELKAGDITAATRKEGLDIQRHEMRISDVKDQALKEFLETASADSANNVRLFDRGGSFMVAKLLGRTNEVDSIEMKEIRVLGNNKAFIESVLAYANSGANLDSINTKFAADSVYYQKPQWIALYSSEGDVQKNLGLQENVYDSLYNSNGSYMVFEERNGITRIGTVTGKKSPKQIVEYESVDYVLQPSDKTLEDARAKLQKFIDTNNTASKFMANAAKAGYNVQEVDLTPSTPAVPMMMGSYYPDSRSLVRWVIMDGKDGEVSKIYQNKNAVKPAFYVAAVLDTYNDYVPWDNKNVKDMLTAQVRREKAGKEMAEKYKAKGNIAAASQAMGVEPVDIESLQSTKRDAYVTDNKVKGRILGSKPSGKMQVAQGDDGVYVFVVNSVGNEEVGMTDEQFANMFMQFHQPNPELILKGNKKIENNIYKFEQGE